MGPDETTVEQAGERVPPRGLEPGTGRAAPRVLVAEDQPEMRALLRKALLRRGYDVVDASDGPGLVIAIVKGLVSESQVPDLIITDVRMPGFSGLEVLARLRREGFTTPVILITAFGDTELHREAERLGAACVLDKPFALEDLCAAADALVPAPH